MTITEVVPTTAHTQAETPDVTAPTPARAGTVDAGRITDLEAHVKDLDRRVENNRIVRDAWTLIIFAVAVVALFASVIAFGFGMRAIDEAERHAEAALAPLAVVVAAR